MPGPILQNHYGTSGATRAESGTVSAIRLALTLFVLALLVLSGMGWVWTGVHQPLPQAVASRAVLALGALAACVGLVAIWGRKRGT